MLRSGISVLAHLGVRAGLWGAATILGWVHGPQHRCAPRVPEQRGGALLVHSPPLGHAQLTPVPHLQLREGEMGQSCSAPSNVGPAGCYRRAGSRLWAGREGAAWSHTRPQRVHPWEPHSATEPKCTSRAVLRGRTRIGRKRALRIPLPKPGEHPKARPPPPPLLSMGFQLPSLIKALSRAAFAAQVLFPMLSAGV